MTLKEKKAREFSVDWHTKNSGTISTSRIKSLEFFQAGWDAALEWAAENAQIDVDTSCGYTNAYHSIDKESILYGKTEPA